MKHKLRLLLKRETTWASNESNTKCYNKDNNTNCKKTKSQFDSLKKKINIKYSISAAAVCNRWRRKIKEETVITTV